MRTRAVSGVMARSKSTRWVLLVVPTSTMRAPDMAMMSGMRNDPPISMSSPRLTTTSRPRANSARTIITAAALLFTTAASSAPVMAQMSSRTWSWREPRTPSSTSNSRVE